jgi:hypothetical protein
MEGLARGLWTAVPGTIQSYNSAQMTATVQINIRDFWRQQNGDYTWETVPTLLDVPVAFPRGGGLLLTFPIAAGDECLIVFANRCIDGWWQSGGVQNEMEFRANFLSDGIAVMGLWSLPNVPPAISSSAAQLRTTDGTAYVEVGQDGHITLQTTGAATVTAGAGIILNGNVTINGTLIATGAGTFAGHSVGTHTHISSTPGTATSTPTG